MDTVVSHIMPVSPEWNQESVFFGIGFIASTENVMYMYVIYIVAYIAAMQILCQYTVILTAVGRFGLIAVLLFLSGGNFGSIRSTKICFGF